MSNAQLLSENLLFAGTGGRSQGNHQLGFRPAFLDLQTQVIYPCCFANGVPAPIHLLDGLPDEVVIDRSASGRPVAAKASLVSGFVLNGRFYSREMAARIAVG